MSDRKARFLRTLDALEEQLDKGFFLSFVNKIIVDEKQIYTIINELRSMAPDSFDAAPREEPAATFRPAAQKTPYTAPPAGGFQQEPPKTPAVSEKSAGPSAQTLQAEKEIIERAMREAEEIRLGADEYARNVLKELENRLSKSIKSVSEGIKVLDDRLNSK